MNLQICVETKKFATYFFCVFKVTARNSGQKEIAADVQIYIHKISRNSS